jgi:hypothetical protein
LNARAIPAFALAALGLAIAAPAAAADAPPENAAVAALDCDRLSRTDIDTVLAHTQAPRIIAISGSFGLSTMDPFARFLVAMGYPPDRIHNPASESWSYSSAMASSTLAGMLAWHYEREGMMPLLIGYSGGGNLVMRTLHELDGAFGNRIAVVDALTGEALPRDTIVDPVTGYVRPVLGLKVPYACALATGKLPRFLLGQWTMLAKVRSVPDTVVDFTGLTIEWDAIAGTFPGSDPYRASGTAHVRNVILPATYFHTDLPRTEHLAQNPLTRGWIDAYRPGALPPPLAPDVDTSNLLHAADIWYGVARHWCQAAQRASR